MMNDKLMLKSIDQVDLVVFDFTATLCSDKYFKISPPSCSNWQKLIDQYIFDHSTQEERIDELWGAGKLSIRDIATRLVPLIGIPIEDLLTIMKAGCENLNFNSTVYLFAEKLKESGKATALVTWNFDVFSEVVVSAHNLDSLFNVIINSADYGTIDKKILWAKALELIPGDIKFNKCLLIEDTPHQVKLFEELGGYSYLYKNDAELKKWLDSIGFKLSDSA